MPNCILVTGSTDGIGLETASQLVQRPDVTKVIIHGRSQARADQAREIIIKKHGCADKLDVCVGDFGSLKEVSAMADDLSARFGDSLNVVLCNAGVLMPDRQVTKDGFEMAYQVNHLAHFLLVNKLLPMLEKNSPSRVVAVSSICHNWHNIVWDDMNSEKDYEKYVQYSRTKLMNMLFVFKLHRMLQEQGKVAVIALEPGVIETKLLKNGGFSGSPVSKGAVAPVYCATLDDPKASGKYFSVDAKPVKADKMAHSTDDQDKLWELSTKICEKFM